MFTKYLFERVFFLLLNLENIILLKLFHTRHTDSESDDVKISLFFVVADDAQSQPFIHYF